MKNISSGFFKVGFGISVVLAAFGTYSQGGITPEDPLNLSNKLFEMGTQMATGNLPDVFQSEQSDSISLPVSEDPIDKFDLSMYGVDNQKFMDGVIDQFMSQMDFSQIDNLDDLSPIIKKFDYELNQITERVLKEKL